MPESIRSFGLLMEPAARITSLSAASVDRNELRREVQHLPEFLLALPQRVDQLVLRSNIHPRADELPGRCVATRDPHATDAANLSVGPHESPSEVDCSTARQHLLNLSLDRYPVFRMHQGQIFLFFRRFAVRIESVDFKQLRRPIFEPASGKCPAPHMGKPL